MNFTAKQNGTERGNTATLEQPTTTPPRYVSPEVNVYETAEGYVVEAEMPGVTKEGLDISVETNTLTIFGRRSANDLKAEALWRESSAADYRRQFELDPAIDTSKIEAKLNQGVVTIQLPKSERQKLRKVTVSD